MSKESLWLKWGTLKAWDVDEDGPAFRAIKRYHEDGVNMSAARQRDTDAQKQALYDIIDALDGEITNDWTGLRMTRDEAKAYVRDYGTSS